jgi:hypothetical protein
MADPIPGAAEIVTVLVRAGHAALWRPHFGQASRVQLGYAPAGEQTARAADESTREAAAMTAVPAGIIDPWMGAGYQRGLGMIMILPTSVDGRYGAEWSPPRVPARE